MPESARKIAWWRRGLAFLCGILCVGLFLSVALCWSACLYWTAMLAAWESKPPVSVFALAGGLFVPFFSCIPLLVLMWFRAVLLRLPIREALPSFWNSLAEIKRGRHS